MAIGRKRQQTEAIESLKALVEAGLGPKILEDFEHDVVSCSQRGADDSDTLVAPLDDERLSAAVRWFEAKYKHLVYHAILEEMSFGTVLYMLYATAHEEDVEGHRAAIEQLCPMAFAANLDDPDCSEFGFTPIRVSDGGLRYDSR